MPAATIATATLLPVVVQAVETMTTARLVLYIELHREGGG
jgi:hypothetical protein